MRLLKNIDLSSWHTFQSPSMADNFLILEDASEAATVSCDDIVLGKGSNVILAEHLQSRVLHFDFKGIEVLKEDAKSVEVRAAAGEIWDKFAEYTCRQGWYGLENLAAIPGTVGAAPVQNIGAYGVECADVIKSCYVFDCTNRVFIDIPVEKMDFSYRNSLFKKQKHLRFIILSVTFSLKKNGQLNLNYGPLAVLKNTLSGPHDVFQAVTKLRWSKLPNPKILANAGSFFHNPIISEVQLAAIQKIEQDLPFYAVGNNMAKIPAAWLIEKAGLKGYREGKVAIYDKHALIVVNHGGTGAEIIRFSNKVKMEIKQKFGITLKREPIVIGEIDGA